MQTLTAIVTDGQMMPVEAKPIAAPVVVTAQGLFAHFKAWATIEVRAKSKQCEALRKTVLECLQAPNVEQVKLATQGVIRATQTKDPDGKLQDGPRTGMARKFVSMSRAIFGAVYNGRMSLAELESATNSQTLYDQSRAYLSADPATGRIGIEWTGAALLEGDARVQARIAKVKATARDEAAEAALKLGMSAKQTADLKAQAEKAAVAGDMADQLAKLEESATKAAERMVKSMGKINATRYATKLLAAIKAAQ